VRCQRCDRPVCPECQRPAAVGVQCVDCVREQARTAPRTKTTFGGRQWAGRPVVTWTIIGICVVLNGLQHVPGLGVTEALMLVPAWTAAEPWRLITSAFLHDPTWPFHILLNMYALYLIGPYLEEMFGRVYYVVVYLLTALGGSAGFILLAGGYGRSGNGVYLTSALGASGAVFGLFGALFIVQRRLGRQMGQIAVIIGINLVLGFVVSGIAWQAHIGGLVVGVACAAVLAYAPRERRRVLQVAGLSVIALLVIGATVIGLANVPPAIHV
jgi:membrane associated rhomboid family serine protease